MEKDTTQRIIKTISESIGLPLGDVKPLVKLVDLADSLEIAQLVIDLELEFNVEVPGDDLKYLFTVQDVINYVNPRSH
jgi:acyl carrier protein